MLYLDETKRLEGEKSNQFLSVGVSAYFPQIKYNMHMANSTLSGLKHFYKGRKIFITGHTGFKGAWLSAWLLRWGAQVTGYALPPDTTPSLFTELNIRRHIRSIYADIRDYTHLKKALHTCKPDLIFHLAAQPLVLRSYQNPAETFSTNVLGTAYLLQAASALQTPCPLINVTSDKCYANTTTVHPFKETDRLGGTDPYSMSKALSEQLTAYWREQVGYTALATARAGNIIGGGDWAAQRLIPDIVRSIHAGQPILLRMPYAIRPWQYILDALFGYLLLGKKLTQQPSAYAQAWNFGPHTKQVLTAQDITDKMLQILGPAKVLKKTPDSATAEAVCLKITAEKSRKYLGWQTRYTARQALQHTARWYRAFYNAENAATLVENEFAAYEKTIARLK